MSFFANVVRIACSTAIGRGIVLAFGLDLWAAGLIESALTMEVNPRQFWGLSWTLSGAIGLLGLWAWYYRSNLLALPGRLIAAATPGGDIAKGAMEVFHSPQVAGASGLTSERMPLLDLFDAASANHGWDFADPSLHALDLRYGLRQAGADSDIQFYGKRNRDHESSTRNEIVVAIDASHWWEYELDVLRAIDKRENLYMSTQKNGFAPDAKVGGFADVLVNQTQAMQWLRSSAEAYKGHTPAAPALSMTRDEIMIEALLTPGWVLHYVASDPGKRKDISFNSDGSVGKGQNKNEHTWKISHGLLEITKQNGTLQNFFRYDMNTDQFICTNHPPRWEAPKRGLDDQIIYRKDAK